MLLQLGMCLAIALIHHLEFMAVADLHQHKHSQYLHGHVQSSHGYLRAVTSQRHKMLLSWLLDVTLVLPDDKHRTDMQIKGCVQHNQ